MHFAVLHYGTCPSKKFQKNVLVICTLLFRDTILHTIIKENDLENMQKNGPLKTFFKIIVQPPLDWNLVRLIPPYILTKASRSDMAARPHIVGQKLKNST